MEGEVAGLRRDCKIRDGKPEAPDIESGVEIRVGDIYSPALVGIIEKRKPSSSNIDPLKRSEWVRGVFKCRTSRQPIASAPKSGKKGKESLQGRN